jgi:hypothetical protein
VKVVIQNHYEFITTDGYLFKYENSDVGHNLLRPWVQLYQLGKDMGIHFYTPDQVDLYTVDLAIFMDRPRVEPDIPGANKILILYEPEIVIPDNWDEAYHDRFDKVLTWNDKLVNRQNYIKHNFTVDWTDRLPCQITESEFNKRKLLCLMQTAKNSDHPNSLYPRRIQAIQWFQQNAMFDFDLWGRGWPIQHFYSCRGVTKNKLDTYSKYKFALTFENCDNATGYISEKILDAFMAGIVPIYLGAPNVTTHIPSECFIDMRDFESYDDLYKYLKGVSYQRYCEYLEAIDEFIRSDKANQFDGNQEVKDLLRLIEGY